MSDCGQQPSPTFVRPTSRRCLLLSPVTEGDSSGARASESRRRVDRIVTAVIALEAGGQKAAPAAQRSTDRYDNDDADADADADNDDADADADADADNDDADDADATATVKLRCLQSARSLVLLQTSVVMSVVERIGFRACRRSFASAALIGFADRCATTTTKMAAPANAIKHSALVNLRDCRPSCRVAN